MSEILHLNTTVGDKVFLIDGSNAEITGSELEKLDEVIKVYNLEVADYNTYFVGADGVLVHNYPGDPPPNMSPEGAGRRGAFREAKRKNGIPVSQQPDNIYPNRDRRGKLQPGKIFEFITDLGRILIRDDSAGHYFPDDITQNRGPHFNDPAGNHYDY